jgi:putative transposase
MRYPTSEKLEITRLVEESYLSARLTLAKLGIPHTTF